MPTGLATTPTLMTHENDIPAEKVLFDAANALRGSVESAEYKHLVLGLVFLKYISDAFATQRAVLERRTRDPESDWFTEDERERAEVLEDHDEYTANNVFWVPPASRWEAILAMGSQPDLGVKIDQALDAIEQENPPLRGVLPKVYARAAMASSTLGRLVSEIAKIGFGDDPESARDVLGRVYEYFIKEFARAEGHRGGEFYTPANVVRLLVEMLQPFKGRIFDPACGSCGMFIQSAKFIRAHAGRPDELAIYGQEMNQATWRIGEMNLAIHALSGDVKLGNSLLDDQHAGLKADFIIANPPFNQKKWGVKQVATDARWKWGVPPDGNANYAWIQHFASHLAPAGRAGFILANGSLTGLAAAEKDIRRRLLEDDLVDCIVALPSKLFYTTGIPVCLWFLDRNKAESAHRRRRVLFVDARRLGHKISRTQVELSDAEHDRVVSSYRAWQLGDAAGYENEAGFRAAISTDDILDGDLSLHPGRYVGTPEEDEVDDYEGRLVETAARLSRDLAENQRLATQVSSYLKELGVGV